jgi:6-phosphogluconolactonase
MKPFAAALVLVLACSSSPSVKETPPGADAATSGSGGRGGSGGGSSGGASGSGGASTGGGSGSGGAATGGSGSGGSAMGGAGGTAGRDGAAGAGPDAAGDAAPAAGGGPFAYVGSNLVPEVAVYKLNTATGALVNTNQPAAAGMFPSYLAWDSKGKFLFATTNTTNKVVAFAINASNGGLKLLNEMPTATIAGATGPAHISVHRSGRWVFVAHYGSGHVSVLPVMDDGRVGAATDTQMPGTMAHMALEDPSGSFVFVPCLGSNHVAQFRFDDKAGKLVPNTPPTVTSPELVQPRHIAFDPKGQLAFVITEASNRMISFKLDAKTGTLTQVDAQDTVPAGSPTSFGAHVLVHPSGKWVYGSNRGHNSIVIFSVDGAGKLTLVGHETGGGVLRTPRGFGFDPTFKYLLVANQVDPGFLVVFEVLADGKLRKVGDPTPAPRGSGFVGAVAP